MHDTNPEPFFPVSKGSKRHGTRAKEENKLSTRSLFGHTLPTPAKTNHKTNKFRRTEIRRFN